MRIALGIDTGGTYTDAVLLDQATGQVLRQAKALTTRYDLSVGIREASAAVFAGQAEAEPPLSPADVALVGLSTTLATNAIVEGQGGTVCLFLVGYSPELMAQYRFDRELGTNDFVYIAGGHNELGDEVMPLDEEGLRAAALERAASVEAFAVSGYFSVRNPAHELRARALIEELTGLPVTCGHELSSRLNAVRRATTAALNARLITLLRDLIATVRCTLDEQGIAAPLMVVKGDGSLVQASWAMQRPIETILSGPAASVVGAWHLSGCHDAWVVDVGGTTTDIAALRAGRPTVNLDGARVGGCRTMVQAIDVHTSGLGGDSHVRYPAGGDGGLAIGPRRVVPLSLLASMHPAVVEALEDQQAGEGYGHEPGEFMLAGRPPGARLGEGEQEVLQLLASGPRPVHALTRTPRRGALLRYRVEELVARGVVQRAGFTPTDALHVLGRFDPWHTEAARLGAGLLAGRAGLAVEAFCEQVVEEVARRAAAELVSKVLEDELGRPPEWQREPAAAELLERALRRPRRATPAGPEQAAPAEKELACSLALRQPIVAIGAPVESYLPRVAELLHTRLIIPPHAGVANAVGAVAGSVTQRVTALIGPLPPDGSLLRLFLPDGHRDFVELEEAVRHAESVLRPYAERLARHAGAEQVEVHVERTDTFAQAGGASAMPHEVYLGTELVFTASGRPAAAPAPAGEST